MSVPGADGATDADGEGAVSEAAGVDQRRALGEVSGGVDGLVGMRRKAVVGVPHASVLPDPRARPRPGRGGGGMVPAPASAKKTNKR